MSQKNFSFAVLVIFIALVLVKIFNISYPLTVITVNKTNELAVVGESRVEAIPDKAYVDAGITVNNAPTVAEAQKKIDKTNNEIINAMKDLGVDKSQIKTSNYSITPSYDYKGGTNEISGYNGNATITIKTKKTDLISKIIDGATKAGANQIQGVRFEIEEPDKYRELARTEAIANAKAQAAKLAKSLGIRLGRVVNIVEASPESPPSLYRSAVAESGLGAAGPVIEPGSQTITSIVTLYFEKR